jgi:DNA (cytosine-5)-methyltransferase 1
MTFVPVPQHIGTVTCTWAKGPSNGNVQSGHVVPVINRPTVEVVGTFSQGAHPGGFNGQDAYTGHAIPVAFNGFNGIDMQPSTEVTPTVRAQHIGAPQVLEGGSLAVRRLTPRECERLMGWPDDWTRYADDGSEIADSHRYRMCGNGVVGPVAEWIGRRIATTTMEGDR